MLKTLKPSTNSVSVIENKSINPRYYIIYFFSDVLKEKYGCIAVARSMTLQGKELAVYKYPNYVDTGCRYLSCELADVLFPIIDGEKQKNEKKQLGDKHN